MFSINHERIGTYMKKINSNDKELDERIQNIMIQLDSFGIDLNEKEMKNAYRKFKIMPVDTFKAMYPVINEFLDLSKKEQESTIRNTFKILKIDDLYVNQEAILKNKNYKLDNAFDYINELYSKMCLHSTYVINSIKDDLSENEVLALLEMIDKRDEEIINIILDSYTDWYKKLSNDSKIYKVLDSRKQEAITMSRRVLSEKLNKIKANEEKLNITDRVELKKRIEKHRRSNNNYHIKTYNKL